MSQRQYYVEYWWSSFAKLCSHAQPVDLPAAQFLMKPLLFFAVSQDIFGHGKAKTTRNEWYTLCIIDQVWGQDGWILAKFFFCVFMDQDGVEAKNEAKKTGQASSIKDLF